MNLAKVRNDYDNITGYDNITFTNCTQTQNEDDNIIFKYLVLSIPSSILLFSLIGLMVYTLINLYSIKNENIYKNICNYTTDIQTIVCVFIKLMVIYTRVI